MWRRKRNSSPRACLVSGKEERAGWKGDVPRRGRTHVTLVEGNVKDEKGCRGAGSLEDSQSGGRGMSCWMGGQRLALGECGVVLIRGAIWGAVDRF